MYGSMASRSGELDTRSDIHSSYLFDQRRVLLDAALNFFENFVDAGCHVEKSRLVCGVDRIGYVCENDDEDRFVERLSRVCVFRSLPRPS